MGSAFDRSYISYVRSSSVRVGDVWLDEHTIRNYGPLLGDRKGGEIALDKRLNSMRYRMRYEASRRYRFHVVSRRAGCISKIMQSCVSKYECNWQAFIFSPSLRELFSDHSPKLTKLKKMLFINLVILLVSELEF